MLTIAKSHAANFAQGQQNATYQVIVSNAAGALTSIGAVTVTETIPSGMTVVSMAGAGWACPGTAANNCTRSDSLGTGQSYPAITVTVNVSANAGTPLTNSVTVTGGGSASAAATDPTNIQASGATIWSPSVAPSTPFLSSTPLTVGVKFQSSVNGNIEALRFYKGAGKSGTHIGLLYSYPAGTLLGQATFTNETASGGSR